MPTNDERITHLGELRSVPPAKWSTRDRILHEAARLFTARGYHGASTRDIAEAVGIRQPSLFNHFANKQAMLAELMVYEQTIPADRADELSHAIGSPMERLYRYMLWDFDWYGEMPLDLRGMHEELLDEPGLEAFHADLQRWKRAINRIIRQGVAAGEFQKAAAPVAVTVLIALSWEMARTGQANDDRRRATEHRHGAALFVLRALATDSGTIGAAIAGPAD